MMNILTIDVEDYFMVSAFAGIIKKDKWHLSESRVVSNTRLILSILAKFHAKATFFILGWIGEQYPELVKEIYRSGHEIASHGYDHQLIYNQTPGQFREDVRKSKVILEDIIGDVVYGYRAPSYSITSNCLWAFDVLIEEGFKYDSSVFPIHHARGGIPHAGRFPSNLEFKGRTILELPLSTIRILRCNLPVAGGGYFRLLPYLLLRKSIQKINSDGYSAIIYLHPWEFDPEQPKIAVKGIDKFRHYVNLDKTESKFIKMLSEFKFSTIREVYKFQLRIND